jgi:hypothetical protein
MPRRNDSAKMFRLSQGPTRLPQVVTRAWPTIRLFMSYLQQHTTRQAILDAVERATGAKEREKASRAIDRLLAEVGIPHDHDALCRLVTLALEFDDIADYASQVEKEIIPFSAIPPNEALDAMIDTYHAWVAAKAK